MNKQAAALMVFLICMFASSSGMAPSHAEGMATDTVLLTKTLDSNLTVVYTIRIDTLTTDTVDSRESLQLPPGYIYTADAIVEYAKTYIGTPYRYSSRGPSSFDCSGFTRYVYRNFGYMLENSSRNQYRSSVWPSVTRDSLNIGDLVFFGSRGSSSSVGHVGIVTSVDKQTGDFSFIHASTSIGVCVTNFSTSPYYINRYIGAKRVIPENDMILDDYNLADKLEKKENKYDILSNKYEPATATHLAVLAAERTNIQQTVQVTEDNEMQLASVPQKTNVITDSQPQQNQNTAESQFYKVVKGDNLYRIAKSHNLSLQALCDLNNISNANNHKLQIGDRLRVM